MRYRHAGGAPGDGDLEGFSRRTDRIGEHDGKTLGANAKYVTEQTAGVARRIRHAGGPQSLDGRDKGFGARHAGLHTT